MLWTYSAVQGGCDRFAQTLHRPYVIKPSEGGHGHYHQIFLSIGAKNVATQRTKQRFPIMRQPDRYMYLFDMRIGKKMSRQRCGISVGMSTDREGNPLRVPLRTSAKCYNRRSSNSPLNRSFDNRNLRPRL